MDTRGSWAARRLLDLLELAELVRLSPVRVPLDEAERHAPPRVAGADHLLAHADGHPDGADADVVVAARGRGAAAPRRGAEPEAAEQRHEDGDGGGAATAALRLRLRRHGCPTSIRVVNSSAR